MGHKDSNIYGGFGQISNRFGHYPLRLVSFESAHISELGNALTSFGNVALSTILANRCRALDSTARISCSCQSLEFRSSAMNFAIPVTILFDSQLCRMHSRTASFILFWFPNGMLACFS